MKECRAVRRRLRRSEDRFHRQAGDEIRCRLGKLQGRLSRELTLFVRQMAWLHAVPKPPAGTRRAKLADHSPKISRLDQLKKDGITPQMPPNPLPHIIARLIEIGITETTGMGAAPLSWREIAEWQRNTGVPLAPWEAKLIRQLSLAYMAESRRAEEETCAPPWRSEITPKEREVAEAKLRMVLG